MDVLTDVLETLRARAVCYARVAASGPFGFALGPSVDARFYVALEGRASVTVDDELIELEAGELVLLPHGTAHAVHDRPGTEATPLSNLLAGCSGGPPATLELGSGGERAVLVCGSIVLDDGAHHPLLPVLPKVIALRARDGHAAEWLGPTLTFLAAEAGTELPGARTVVSRLADILFIQVVRAHLTSAPEQVRGWLGALRDPQIGSALGFMHEDPAHAWTVETLAQRVAMSRSTFAARFAEIVGEPPLHYLTRWRMQKARHLLREGRVPMAEVAARVGYDSEAAFSKAFKRAVGEAPGAYRRASRARTLGRAA
jgi:AraC family transcriptional regulator, alkane utilization regulator